MEYPPAFITERPFGAGFAEACNFILGCRSLRASGRETVKKIRGKGSIA
jgi:hypothetical protein